MIDPIHSKWNLTKRKGPFTPTQQARKWLRLCFKELWSKRFSIVKSTIGTHVGVLLRWSTQAQVLVCVSECYTHLQDDFHTKSLAVRFLWNRTRSLWFLNESGAKAPVSCSARSKFTVHTGRRSKFACKSFDLACSVVWTLPIHNCLSLYICILAFASKVLRILSELGFALVKMKRAAQCENAVRFLPSKGVIVPTLLFQAHCWRFEYPHSQLLCVLSILPVHTPINTPIFKIHFCPHVTFSVPYFSLQM